MALDNVTRLAYAELALYILLLPLLAFLLIRHFKNGVFGWAFLVAFGLLRIVSSALQIDNELRAAAGKTTSITAEIVNSVGVSALLLAISGIIGEAASYIPGTNAACLWVVKLALHVPVVVGTALAAIGAANFANPPGPSNKYSNDLHLIEAGYVLLLLVLIALFAFGIGTALRLGRHRAGGAERVGGGPVLLVWLTLLALCFTGARVVYGFIFAFGHDPKLSPISGVFVVKFVLIFLVQLLAVICLIAGGLMFRPGKVVPVDA